GAERGDAGALPRADGRGGGRRMKPVRLQVQGFTAFREPATVDFEGRRLFVITGPTGAGKSSLLDAITWALYGEVPRVGASTKQLISHHAPSMSVQFEFDSRGR